MGYAPDYKRRVSPYRNPFPLNLPHGGGRALVKWREALHRNLEELASQ